MLIEQEIIKANQNHQIKVTFSIFKYIFPFFLETDFFLFLIGMVFV